MKATKTAGDERSNRSDDGKDKNVGDALRAVYQDAASEQVPDEFLDLLSKLK